MKTYATVKNEIAKLEKQAEALRKNELKTVVAQIRKAIDAYGLTAADLGLGPKAAAARKPAAKRRGPTTRGTPKYRDPKTGLTWTGWGRPPAWIVAAKNRADYLIADPAPAKAAPKAKKSRAKRPPAQRRIKTPAVRIESGVASG